MLTLRSVAERLSRDVVLRRTLPGDLGGAALFVSPGKGGLRYWRPGLTRIDPNLLRFARERVRPGMKVWDIGANVGLFTFAAAFQAGPGGSVLAVEPDAESVALLLRTRRNLPRDRYASVDVLTAALAAPGERIGQLSMATRAGSANALAGFGTTQMGGEREQRTVALVTLDELLIQYKAPDVIKIDVEGAELAVLRGAARLLETRPVLHVEVAGENALGVGDVLRSHGYRFVDADSDGSETVQPAPNCLAIPNRAAFAY